MSTFRGGDIVKSSDREVSTNFESAMLRCGHRPKRHQIIYSHDSRGTIGSIQQLAGQLVAAMLRQIPLKNPLLLDRNFVTGPWWIRNPASAGC